ncbi:oleate hydratase [Breznakiella homolactica]|uniref:Oleate hydratase n=1 Tax=Breznakiella homolactica TaxID=2798577 RepID=A0A7T7XM77_9SPIR|nr:oleate hydratase [Breznakiella homolactica]QQO08876.1 oleate hydratase [Breznakiella homolactica]
MYHSNGNFEAFARPVKPEGVDNKSAYLIGGGLAGLAAAAFLVRDAQMKGQNIHVLEQLKIPGGSLDGICEPQGWVIRGGREMENHFECLWDLFRSIPSLDVKDASVLDEFYWLNKKDPNYSHMRATIEKGKPAPDLGKFTLDETATKEMVELILATEESLNDKKINEVFGKNFFKSNFWLYWRSMFAFEEWHSAMEMRRYVMRFIHHLDGLPDLSALKFTKYNQYESLVLPLVDYLKKNGVQFMFSTIVKDIEMDLSGGKKTAKKILYTQDGKDGSINLTENDLVFVTNGSITESSSLGDHKTPAKLNSSPGGSWGLWQTLAAKDPAFGKPAKFCGDIPKTKFISATITTLDDKIPPYIEKICKRDPFAGTVVTGGIVTVKDSSWLLSWTLNRQPHFHKQGKNELVVWFYALFNDVPGDYVKKTASECTGIEIAQEWLYHMGVPENQIPELAEKSTNTVPVMMPYVMSYFMPRRIGDRPLVVPQGSVNLAFIGNFSETERDTVFTTEYSVRTAMEAVYTLLNVDRGVPETFASAFDLRILLSASHEWLDKKKITEIKLPFILRWLEHKGLEKAKGTFIYEMLEKSGLV